jgi:hypothetical protein
MTAVATPIKNRPNRLARVSILRPGIARQRPLLCEELIR